MTDKNLQREELEADNKLFELLCIRKGLFEELSSYDSRNFKRGSDFYDEDEEESKRVLYQRKIKSINEKIAGQESIIKKIITKAKASGIELPLVQICETYRLNELERYIVIILFFSASGKMGEPTMTAGELFSFLFHDRTEFIINKKLFYEDSTLRKSELIKVSRWGDTLLETNFTLTERMLRKIAGDTENLEDKDLKEFDEQTRPLTFKADVLQIREPVVSFDKVVLATDKRRAIEKTLWQVQDSKRIFEDWGFNETLFYGTTVSMLFYGPLGTGKTMTAEAIAHKLHKKLGIANYAKIVSCWVGESEKHVLKVFEEAKKEDCVLVFDEADAIFSKRLDAENSVDMMNNRMINLLLQELERFEGVIILTSNREVALDEAFERRISLRLKFDIPKPDERAEIWASFFTDKAPLDLDVDFDKLGERFELSGGHIKNAVLNAVRECAFKNGGKKDSKITMRMLKQSAKNEVESLIGAKGRIGFCS